MRIGFALEYSLGHTTHAQNLKRALVGDGSVQPLYIDLPFHDTPGVWSRLPGVKSNWSLRASLAAYFALRPHTRSLQAALFHTQVTSLFSAGLMRRLPSVISLDATPAQYDMLGSYYGHKPGGNSQIEAFKKRLNVNAFAAARHLVTWSQWTKDSLIADYGAPADKVTVIPPGIDTEQWDFARDVKRKEDPIDLLFVGGDFQRKGGDLLMEAFRSLPDTLNARLHLVTKTENVGDGVKNVHVYRDLTANSEGLRRLYAQADAFIFPTRADCLPLAILEALAAGLPIVTTNIGALPEAVTHGKTGLIVPPDSATALAEAITTLATDARLRTCLGWQARETAQARFDAKTNYRRLLDTVSSVAY